MASKEETIIAKLNAQIKVLEEENSSLLRLASHDVRSPLNKVYALLGLLKMTDNPLSEEQNHYVEKIEAVLADGLGRMRNLMDLQSIQTSGIKTMMENLDVGSLTAKIIREYNPVAERKNITLNYRATKVALITDRLGFTRILDQLISNAIKFTPDGKTIAITIEDNDEDVVINIQDGGFGITEDEQENLYKKFKVLSTRTTAGESTMGVGLYIAQWNAKNIGGNIHYSNKQGSTFSLTLPKIILT